MGPEVQYSFSGDPPSTEGVPIRVGEGLGCTATEMRPHAHLCPSPHPPAWDLAQADADDSASGLSVGGQLREFGQEIAAVVEGSSSHTVHTAAPAGSQFKTGLCPRLALASQCSLGWRTVCV